jgi:hypothetical protein
MSIIIIYNNNILESIGLTRVDFNVAISNEKNRFASSFNSWIYFATDMLRVCNEIQNAITNIHYSAY